MNDTVKIRSFRSGLTLARCEPLRRRCLDSPLAPNSFRTIALFGDFARLAKHMRFPAQTRESPHFPASTRPIVKHIFGTSRGDDGAELAAAEKSLMC